MRHILIATTFAFAMLATAANAAPCKDAHGKFTKCPEVTSTAQARCKDASGKFAKCSAPGAKPVSSAPATTAAAKAPAKAPATAPDSSYVGRVGKTNDWTAKRNATCDGGDAHRQVF